MYARLVRSGLSAVLLCMALAAPAAERGYRQTADGVAIYSGIVPAEPVRGHHPPGHPEHGMHDGVPAGENHAMVALFGDRTGQRITGARITATVGGTRKN